VRRGSGATPWLTDPHRPHVLYVAQMPEYSGAELAQMPVMLTDAAPLLACPPGSRMDELAQSRGIPTTPLPFRSLRHSGGRAETVRSIFRGLAGARDLRRVLRAHPDRRIVYCMQIRPGLLAGIAAIGLRRQVVCNVTDFLPPPPLRQATKLAFAATVSRCIAHSGAIAADLVTGSKRLGQRTTQLSPGIHVDRYDPSAADAGAPRAAIVGHVSPTKRTHEAVDIARRVLAELPAFELRIVGRAQYRHEDFDYEAELKRAVADDPALRESVRFCGYASDVPDQLRGLGLLLHCRPDEPFGIVPLEAMAAGLPVVAPRSSGLLETVVDGETGLLYEPDNLDAAARCVLALVTDPERAGAMGVAGRRRVEERFSVAVQLAGVDRLLSEVA